jgi:hypothetical protein
MYGGCHYLSGRIDQEELLIGIIETSLSFCQFGDLCGYIIMVILLLMFAARSFNNALSKPMLFAVGLPRFDGHLEEVVRMGLF